MTLLLYLAYVLAVLLTFTRVTANHPTWQLRAELISMFAGIVLLTLLAILTYPHTPPHVQVDPFPSLVA